MSRREFPARVRIAAYERCKGLCESCGALLQVGRFHYDHVVPDGLGGEPTLENCAVLCRPCHDEKTAGHDVPAITKAKRQEQVHLGARPPSRSPLPCGKRSRWKRTVDGRTVLR